MKLDKDQKKHLRELVGKAYERDLSRCLKVVGGGFDRWESGEIDVWELNELVHKFHNNIARALYNSYEPTGDLLLSVAFGVKQGVLELDEVDEEFHSYLNEILGQFDTYKANEA